MASEEVKTAQRNQEKELDLSELFMKTQTMKILTSASQGKKMIVFAETAYVKEFKVNHAAPVSVPGSFYEIEGVSLPGVELVKKGGIIFPYTVFLRIPIALIRAMSYNVIVLEATSAVEVDRGFRHSIYVPQPSSLGWLMLRELTDRLLSIKKEIKSLSSMGVIVGKMDELLARAVNLSIPAKVVKELKALPSPLMITEDDQQEFFREKFEKRSGGR